MDQNGRDDSMDQDKSSSEKNGSYEYFMRRILPHCRQEKQIEGYLDEKTSTLVMGSDRVKLNRKRNTVTKLPGGSYFFLNSEPGSSNKNASEPNFDDNRTSTVHHGSNLELIGSEGTQEIKINRNDNSQCPSKEPDYDIQDEDATVKMVFVPTYPIHATIYPFVYSKTPTPDLHEKNTDLDREKSETTFIVSQTLADSHFSKVEDVDVRAVNEEKNYNLRDKSMSSENEASLPTRKENSSTLSVSSQDIDNVSVDVYTSTFIPDQDWETKNIQKDENQTEEASQPYVMLPVTSKNINNFDCSNLKNSQNTELSTPNPVKEESSYVKDGIYFSNGDYNKNYDTSTVKDPVDEDTKEFINLLPQLPSGKNIDESKQKDNISFNGNDSDILIDVDQRQNLDNILYASSNNCENINVIPNEASSDKFQGSSEAKDETIPKIFCPDKENEQMNHENSLVKEDEYINLFPSSAQNKIKPKGPEPPVDESSINLGLQSSDDFVMGAEDSLNEGYFAETSCKPKNSETDVPKVSFRYVSSSNGENISVISIGAASDKCTVKPPEKTYVRKRKTSQFTRNLQLFSSDNSEAEEETTPKIFCPDEENEQMNHENSLVNEDESINLFPSSAQNKIKPKGPAPPSIDVGNDSYESDQQRDNLMKNPAKGKIHKTIYLSSPENVKMCTIKFFNDHSSENNNAGANKEMSSLPSTKDAKEFLYTCSYCKFTSYKVNNLIIHLKYCKVKASTVKDNKKKKLKRMYSKFTEDY